MLAGTTPPEPGFLDVLARLAPIVSAAAAVVVALIMARGVRAMNRSNDQRAEADKRRAKAAVSMPRERNSGPGAPVSP